MVRFRFRLPPDRDVRRGARSSRPPPPTIPSARWWAHVSFLASDDLQGRDTGSEGHKKAAAYVAEQFKAAGLAPAGTSGYLQPVRFTSRTIVEAQSSLALVRDGKVEPVALGTGRRVLDAHRSGAAGRGAARLRRLRPVDPGAEDRRSGRPGPPRQGRRLPASAARPASPTRSSAHAQSAAARWAALKQAGAIGAIVLQHPGRHGAALGALHAGAPAAGDGDGRCRRSTTPPASRSRSPSIRPAPSGCSPAPGTRSPRWSRWPTPQAAARLPAPDRRSAPR